MTITTLYPEPTAAASVRRPIAYGTEMDREHRLKRLRFRAWHRGTKEADLLIGGFFDAHAADWSDEQIARFEMRSEEHTSELQSLMRNSYAVFCLNKKTKTTHITRYYNTKAEPTTQII